MKYPLELGTKTKWGTVGGVISQVGELRERFYFLLDKHGTVSLMPADVVEAPITKD